MMLRLVSWNASHTFVRPVHVWNRRHIRSVRFNTAESTCVIRSSPADPNPMLPPNGAHVSRLRAQGSSDEWSGGDRPAPATRSDYRLQSARRFAQPAQLFSRRLSGEVLDEFPAVSIRFAPVG